MALTLKVPEGFSLAWFCSIMSAVMMMLLFYTIYRTLFVLFNPIQMNWFHITQRYLLILFYTLQIVQDQSLPLIDSDPMNSSILQRKQTFWQKVIFYVSLGLLWIFYFLHIFEQAVYVHFVNFQAKYRIEELPFKKNYFNKREKKMLFVFVILALSVGCSQLYIIIIDSNDRWYKDLIISVKSIQITIISVILVLIITLELLLEIQLSNYLKVQYAFHKTKMRFQVFLFISSLVMHLIYQINLTDEALTQQDLPFISIVMQVPPATFCLVKDLADCFDCFNKSTENFRYYSIF